MASIDSLVLSSPGPSPGPYPTPGTSSGDMEVKCWFDEEFKFILLPVSYAVVFVLGLGLNVPTLFLFLFRLHPWDATATYMFHLALSDTLYVLSLPTLIYYYAAHNHWPFGTGLCKFVRFFFYWNLYSSVLFLTCISVHRYLGICHPLRALRWGRPHIASLICLAVWLTVAACLVPNLFFVTTSTRGATTLCHDTTKPEDFDHYVHFSSAVMVLLFGLPFLVTLLCYGLMAWRLWQPLPGAAQSSTRLRSLRTIAVVLTVFAICFVPFHITRTIYYLARLLEANCQTLGIVNITYKVTRPLASANSCLDPVLYLLTGDKYRRQLQQLCCKRPKQVHAVSALALVSQPEESSFRCLLLGLGSLLLVTLSQPQHPPELEPEAWPHLRNLERTFFSFPDSPKPREPPAIQGPHFCHSTRLPPAPLDIFNDGPPPYIPPAPWPSAPKQQIHVV